VQEAGNLQGDTKWIGFSGNHRRACSGQDVRATSGS
jgi:hypothetical protein